MTYQLDTNVCVEMMRRRPESIVGRVRSAAVGDLGISAITLAELQYGVWKSRNPEQNAALLETFLMPLVVAPFDQPAADRYGPLRVGLERSEQPIVPLDFLIAAHALQLGVTLMTNNTREFERVEWLSIEDWSQST